MMQRIVHKVPSSPLYHERRDLNQDIQVLSNFIVT